MASLKRAVASLATSPPLRPFFRALLSDRLTIFMLHRFADTERGTPGHDPDRLRLVLERLRREDVPLLSLEDAVSAVCAGNPIKGVVFTVDDGYDDFARCGQPVFREFDCPVTVFLTTGFVDGVYWFWWDRLQLAFRQSPAAEVRLPTQLQSRVFPLGRLEERQAAATAVVRAVKTLPESARSVVLDSVFAQAAVALPETPPEGYGPMAWNTIRGLAAQGVGFAPHTVSHPSMASLPEPEMRAEVRGSVARMRAEAVALTPVFCYPYGLAADVSQDAARAVAAEGMLGAVTALPGYVGAAEGLDPMLLPRFAFPEDELELTQIIYGVERFKEIVRSR